MKQSSQVTFKDILMNCCQSPALEKSLHQWTFRTIYKLEVCRIMTTCSFTFSVTFSLKTVWFKL